MRLAQLLFFIAAAIFCLLGVTHAVLMIRDLHDPRSFTPTDDTVRQAMMGARLRLAPVTTISLLAVRFWFPVPAAAAACGALSFLASAIVIGVAK